MIKRALIVGGTACLAVVLAAQNSNPPTFTTGARLIEISVLANERGNPVLNLAKEDFRIRDNKRDAMISFFIAPQPGAPQADSGDRTGLAEYGLR